ncbi:WD repeat-containing protein 36 [Grus japonensis]|uniref:WD repeat-containing protein 36 n=1 Tax=Grus japonensis TaxID=30415 RepID=A0ABC9Y654_GRUJA
MAREGGGLFAGFRVLGRFSGHVPHVLRYHGRHREFYLATAVGCSIHTYNVKKLGIVAVSNALPRDITCLAADRMLIFASYDNILHAFARNKEAPAVDVVAVGLVSGHIIVHNIKFDETLMKFQQDWGPITAISFRTDGHPVMAAGSPIGHIALWDLEEKKLMCQMQDAHSTAIAGMSFVPGEPLLITNGADNAIRPVVVLGIAPTHVQDLALGFVELHAVRRGPPLQPVKVTLDGIPSLQHVNRTTQLGVVGKLAEGALFHVTDKDVKLCRSWY